MPRPLRLEFPGARYHVMSRGDHREEIFRSDKDRILFLDSLDEACGKTGWVVHAYCLMTNHFHLLVETPRPNLVSGMKWLLSVYTIRFNARHRLRGHLFSGRYKALVIDPEDDTYMRLVCQYIHLNPSRAKLLAPEQPLESFAWSSYPAYLGKPARRPKWLRTDVLMGELGLAGDDAKARVQLKTHMEAWRLAEDQGEYAPIRRGWFLGDREARRALLRRHAPSQRGGFWREAEEERAEALVAAELRKRRWDEERLAQERKGHPIKIATARRLREETTMTLPWIADRLKMGSAGYLHALLRQQK